MRFPLIVPRRFNAFTLIELLVVIAIAAVLAALLFPVFSKANDKGRQAACANSLRQLGAALQMYLDDYDSGYPLKSWGGGIQGYVKNAPLYRCPNDATGDAEYRGARLSANSYAMNFNLFRTRRSVDVLAPAQTVQLFEASGCRAELADASEGIRSDSQHPPQISCAGNGTSGGIVTIGPAQGDPEPEPPQYATGLIDNGKNASDSATGQYGSSLGRHSEGANYLAADGHVKWLKGVQVSAGENALASADPQSSTGCPYPGIHDPQNSEPCAEGVAHGRHVLTFSIR